MKGGGDGGGSGDGRGGQGPNLREEGRCGSGAGATLPSREAVPMRGVGGLLG